MSLDFLTKLKSSFSLPGQEFTSFDMGIDEQTDDDFSPTEAYRVDQFEIFQPLPGYSIVLGVCDDGLPLVLDLNDPKPGAILIIGPSSSGKTALLRSIVNSACSTNTSDQLYFYMISPQPGRHKDLSYFSHCYGVHSTFSKSSCELIVDLAGLVEQRKSGRHLGPKCILAIDNLYELIKHQDFDVIDHLKWLYRFGADNGVWMISTIDTDRTNLIDQDLLSEPKTQIFSGTERLSLPETAGIHSSQRNQQSYRARSGNQLVDFWLPSSN